MLVTSEGGQRVAFATTKQPQENGISAANLATRWSSPGYSDMYTKHIRGECWSAETKDVQDGSNLHKGLLDAGALHLISCPVGLPMRGAVSASFDYPNPDLEAAIATLKEIAPTLEPLLIAQSEP